MLNQEKFDELKASGQLPSPQGAALKIIELCQYSNASLPAIIQVMKTDPGLVGRVLKMANAPVFGRTRPVVSLTPDVLITIGTQSLRQVVLAFSLVSAHRDGRCRNFDYEAFWSQSLAMGVAAQLLGAAERVAPPVEMFTCGLLAQVGRLALASLYPERYSVLLEQVRPARSLAALEQDAFAIAHDEVAAAMMADWGIPRIFTDAVLLHETPAAANLAETTRSARLLWCLHLAWRFSALCFMPDTQRALELPKLFSVGQKLGLEAEAVVQLGDQMLAEWKAWSAVLEIATRPVTAFADLESVIPPPPAGPEAEPDIAPESPRNDAQGDGVLATILVVDDDPTMLLLLKRLLGNAGHSVHTAVDGEDALRQALQVQPHIIISDWLMPGMDGLQLIRALRQTQLGRGVYIMVLTALREDEKLADAFDAGADDFLVKPVNPTILQARLKAGLRRLRVQQEIADERDLLRRNAMALTIANQRAEAAALTDSLTGLYNRRYAMERLTREWEAANRSQQPLSLLMLDIDHFKQINDTHGHHVGDAALRRLAELLRDFTRSPDVACRIGGEEFCIITPATTLAGAMSQAERLRSGLGAVAIDAGGQQFRLAVSIGVAQRGPGVAGPEQLLELADKALYKAKRDGRNRVVVAPIT